MRRHSLVNRRSGASRSESRGGPPPVTVIEIDRLDEDGEPIARPVKWDRRDPAPVIRLDPREPPPAPGVGDRMLARLFPDGDGIYTARIIRRFGTAQDRLLGIFECSPDGRAGWVWPVERRHRTEYAVAPNSAVGIGDGALVWVEPAAGRHCRPKARIVECAAPGGGPVPPSLIEIHARGIPTEFSEAALAAAAAATPVPNDGRMDLRALPLVTIDGSDARDFDDAVWAAPDDDPDNPGGWRIVVAIADVAWYVRPGTALDVSARERGNSVYFPDRVVPMLPEALSNGLCSLVPGEDRGCIAADIRIDAEGRLLDHTFRRAVMRSIARLTYEQVDAARRGEGLAGLPISEDLITSLYGAFGALSKARDARGALDLDVPGFRVELDGDGNVREIAPEVRLDSHRLIEEFMIAANVAAAETLESLRAPCIYRVHDQPSKRKLEELARMLRPLGIVVARQVRQPPVFRHILDRVAGTSAAPLVNMAILRSQSQAEYGPENIGHFGLGLRRYAHFTSPIRRYADLVVHRSLLCALDFEDEPETSGSVVRLEELGQHLSMTERRAADAERGVADRYAAMHMEGRDLAEFAAVVSGIHRAGLFVTLERTGASGFVPMSMLGDERFDMFEEKGLVGRRTGAVHAVGDRIAVRLEEANGLTGSMVFSVLDGRRRERKTGSA